MTRHFDCEWRFVDGDHLVCLVLEDWGGAAGAAADVESASTDEPRADPTARV